MKKSTSPLQGSSLPALKSWEQLTYKVQKQKPLINTPESISHLVQRGRWAMEMDIFKSHDTAATNLNHLFFIYFFATYYVCVCIIGPNLLVWFSIRS